MQRTEPHLQDDIYLQELVFNGQGGEISHSSFAIEVGIKDKTAIYIKKPRLSEEKENAADLKEKRILRIIYLITKLASLTRKAHLAAKDKYPLLITRLVMDEFSLYTSDEPLSVDEFKQLTARISTVVKQLLPPHVHLVIATLPVLWPDGSLRNSALYVQSPSSPQGETLIHYFCKHYDSKVDYRYADEEGHLYKLNTLHDPLSGTPSQVLADCGITFNDVNQFESALKIDLGERSFITVIDICLDHDHAVGEKSLLALLKQLFDNGKAISLHLSHLLISATVSPKAKKSISAITQADPFYCYNYAASAMRKESDLLFGKTGEAWVTTHLPRKLHLPHRLTILLNYLSLNFTANDLLQAAARDLQTDFDEFAIKRLRALRKMEGIDFSVLGAQGQEFLSLLDGLDEIEKQNQSPLSSKKSTRFFKQMPLSSHSDRKEKQAHDKKFQHITAKRYN